MEYFYTSGDYRKILSHFYFKVLGALMSFKSWTYTVFVLHTIPDFVKIYKIRVFYIGLGWKEIEAKRVADYTDHWLIKLKLTNQE